MHRHEAGSFSDRNQQGGRDHGMENLLHQINSLIREERQLIQQTMAMNGGESFLPPVSFDYGGNQGNSATPSDGSGAPYQTGSPYDYTGNQYQPSTPTDNYANQYQNQNVYPNESYYNNSANQYPSNPQQFVDNAIMPEQSSTGNGSSAWSPYEAMTNNMNQYPSNPQEFNNNNAILPEQSSTGNGTSAWSPYEAMTNNMNQNQNQNQVNWPESNGNSMVPDEQAGNARNIGRLSSQYDGNGNGWSANQGDWQQGNNHRGDSNQGWQQGGNDSGWRNGGQDDCDDDGGGRHHDRGDDCGNEVSPQPPADQCNDQAQNCRVWGDPHFVAADGSSADDQIASGSNVDLLQSSDGSKIIGQTGTYNNAGLAASEGTGITVFSKETVNLGDGTHVQINGDGTAYQVDGQGNQIGADLTNGQTITSATNPNDSVTYNNNSLSYTFNDGTSSASGTINANKDGNGDYLNTSITSASGNFGGMLPALDDSFKGVTIDKQTGAGMFKAGAGGQQRTNQDFLVNSLYG